MKKIKLFGAALGLMALMLANTSQASLGTVVLTNHGGNANGGGLFQAVTSQNGTFDTFCLSIPTTFYLGHTYYYDISSTIVANGVPPAASYITLGTAYIYSQFRAGNANYAGAGNANAVQAAIWYLQGDLNGYVDPENNVNLSTYVNSILTKVLADNPTWTLNSLTQNGNGYANVFAMNLYTTASTQGGYAQPQLFQAVPEPSTVIAGALMLLPFCISTLRILRKSKV